MVLGLLSLFVIKGVARHIKKMTSPDLFLTWMPALLMLIGYILLITFARTMIWGERSYYAYAALLLFLLSAFVPMLTGVIASARLKQGNRRHAHKVVKLVLIAALLALSFFQGQRTNKR